jgi:hypothetical protein
MRSALLAGLVAVLVMGLAVPGLAGMTKIYKCPNNTGVSQSSLQATTNGLESITGEWAKPDTWLPAATGWTIVSGVYCSTVTFDGPSVAPGSAQKIGWKTADASCRLRDLSWGDGQSVVPTQIGGTEGGGMLFYDWPYEGCVTIVITNDTEAVITLADVEFALTAYEYSLAELDPLLDVGLVELRVEAIDEALDVLRAEIAYYDSLGVLPSPSGTSIDKKAARAIDYKHTGLNEYLAGDLDRALFYWDKSAHQVENLIGEVSNLSAKGNLATELYERWVVHGDGEITPASQILEDLLALPEGQALQSLQPLPCADMPADPGLDPADCVEWPVDELYPGEHTAFFVCDLDFGSGFIMGGSIFDGDGNLVLEWLEQYVVEPGLIDTEPPEITATATPDCLWPPDHEFVDIALDVTVEDNTFAVAYIESITSNQPILGTGDGDYAPDWLFDPTDLQSVSLRAERSGSHPEEVRVYTITLRAIDTGGNLSDPCELVIRVDHDQGSY